MTKKYPNYTYGVDTNNKQAVAKEYLRLRKKRTISIIVTIIAIIILLLPVIDFILVEKKETKPIFAIKTITEEGTLYKGIGYNVLYCKDGQRITGSKELTCNKE